MSQQYQDLPTTLIPTKMKNRQKLIKKQGNMGSEEVKTFHDDNVLLHIHSPSFNQSYKAKTFPAKFSINISNETKELGSGTYNQTKYRTSNPNQTENMNNQRISFHKRACSTVPKQDSYYEQVLNQYKDQYDRLIQQTNQNCDKYENYIRQLEAQRSSYQDKIQQLLQQIKDCKKKGQKDSKYLQEKQQQLDSIAKKNRSLEGQFKKNRDKMYKQDITWQEKQNIYELKIKEFENLLAEKQIMIKKLNQSSNNNYDRMMKQQQFKVHSEVQKMDKWLKNFNKVVGGSQQTAEKQSNSQRIYQFSKQNKNMKLQIQILKKTIEQLLQKIRKKNQIIDVYEGEEKKLINYIVQLEERINNFPIEQATNENFKQINHELNYCSQFQVNYDGTVKVKMNLLLHQKDKRINALQEQLREIKCCNIQLKNQIQKLEYQLSNTEYNYKSDLKRVKSECKYDHLNQVSWKQNENIQNSGYVQGGDINMQQTLNNYYEASRNLEKLQQKTERICRAKSTEAKIHTINYMGVQSKNGTNYINKNKYFPMDYRPRYRN